MKPTLERAVVCVLLGLLASSVVRADIYWFQDEKGTIHISNVPVDRRFRFKERESVPEPPGILYEGRRKGYDKLIDKVARTQGLDPDLLRAVVEVESGFDPAAISRKGAVGLMQLMPETAREMGATNRFHPVENLEAGARYLRRLIDRYGGELALALAAYNAGEKAVDRYNGIPPFPETRGFVDRVLKAYREAVRQRGAPEAGTVVPGRIP